MTVICHDRAPERLSGRGALQVNAVYYSDRNEQGRHMMHPPPLAGVLSRLGGVQAPLPASVAALIGMVTFVLMNSQRLFQVARPAGTVVHEAAHALVGLGAGRRIRSVIINRDGGATDMVPNSGAGYVAAASAGYIGPSAAGLISAELIHYGRIVTVLWLGLLLVAAMLLMVRNFFGGIIILVCGTLLYLIVIYAKAGAQTAVAYGVTWFLLIYGPKLAIGAASKPGDVADAKILAGMTFLWPSAWCFLWVIGTIGALVAGGALLVLPWASSGSHVDP